jgi:hypothetical protein
MEALTYIRNGNWITVSIPVPRVTDDNLKQSKIDEALMKSIMDFLSKPESE